MHCLPEPEPFSQDELLTPCHSIPLNIHSSFASASKGRFSEDDGPAFQQQLAKKLTKIPTINQNRASPLSGSPPRKLVSAYTQEKNKRQADSVKIERKLTETENSELFSRLDKVCEIRKERLQVGKANIGQSLNSSIIQEGKKSGPFGYPKKSILKSIEKSKFNDDIRPPEICSSKSKFQSARTSFSSPSKSINFLLTPPKDPFSNKKVAKKSTFQELSSNSPLKVIQKIQNLVKGSYYKH